jgi:hypothetical protein
MHKRDDDIIAQGIEQMIDKNAEIIERVNNLTLGEQAQVSAVKLCNRSGTIP